MPGNRTAVSWTVDVRHVGTLDLPQIVTATPVMFKGVSTSPKNQAEIVIVETSFAMPAIDIGTTPARWMILPWKLALEEREYVTECVRDFAEDHAEG